MKNQTFTYLGDDMHGTCLVSANETGGAFSLFHIVAALGASVPPHVHHNEDEAFYVLKGSFQFQMGERIVTAGPGCVGFGPRGVPHSLACTSEHAELLVMALPGGFEAFFTALEAHGPLPMPPAPTDIEGFFGLLARFGMTPAAPLPEGTPVEALSAQPYPKLDLGDHRICPKLIAEDTKGALVLSEIEADYGGSVPLHVGEREYWAFYVLSGRFAFGIGGDSVEAAPGDCILGPCGIEQSWRCVSPEGGRLLIYVAPGE